MLGSVGDSSEVEYSIAEEYQGPSVTYNLPRAIPIDIKRIPTALPLITPRSLSSELGRLPVIQPLVPSHKKGSKDQKLVTYSAVSPTSVIRDGQSSSNSSGTITSPSPSPSPVIIGECSNDRKQLQSSNQKSPELSGEIGGSNESRRSQNDHHPDWDSTESESSSQFGSPEIRPCEPEDYGIVTPNHDDANRTSVVDAELSDNGSSSADNGRREPETKVKKRVCNRCFKGNRFTTKEACIVCNAMYCGNCVLRAMGSMPEGRKCVTCIGLPIDESKRGSLGTSSRLLKKLLSKLEIQQIMKAERLCDANLLQVGTVYVNGQQLCKEELVLLQSCPHPPTKLKPGRYWYDNVSGLWGQEGEKPCKIISSQLSIGGDIMPNASNGNTNVFINNREITKMEKRLLKLVGVQCAGSPHFWLDEYGQYQEEGQKNVKGNLWKKPGLKVACAALSLPTPYKVVTPSAEEANNLGRGNIPGHVLQRSLQKLLLVGYDGSGTSTIFKQAKMLYKDEPFSQDERQDIKLIIQRNIFSYMGILLEGRERFEEECLAEIRRKRLLDNGDVAGSANNTEKGMESSSEGLGTSIYSIGPRLKEFSDWLLKAIVLGTFDAIFPASSREYAPVVEQLWKDAAIQATFDRRNELPTLPSVASYFFERVVDISMSDYEPSDTDILYAEGLTSSNGVACMDFTFPQSVQNDVVDAVDQNDPSLRYQLIKTNTRGLGENCKWLEMFDDVRIVIFCVSMSDYDQFFDDGNGVSINKMLVSKKLFEDLITHPTAESMDFHLVLNKFDLLEEKVERVPLSQCNWFNDFSPIKSRQSADRNNPNYVASVAEQAFHYIAVKFKRHFNSLTGRKLHVSLVNGLESDSVDVALRYAKAILKWDEERPNFNVNETTCSSEHSSSYSD